MSEYLTFWLTKELVNITSGIIISIVAGIIMFCAWLMGRK